MNSNQSTTPAFPSPLWGGVRGGGNVRIATRCATRLAGSSSERGKAGPQPSIPPHKGEGGVDAAPRPNRVVP